MKHRDLTNDQKTQPQNTLAGAGKKESARKTKAIFLGLLALLAWAGLVYGGYYYAVKHLQETRQHVSSQVDRLILENERIEERIRETMQSFKDELDSSNLVIGQIRQELDMIQEELTLAGETISGSDQTRQSLQERMAELDRQFAALKEQLKKLEEAVRAF